MLAFLAVDDGGAGILAEGEHAFDGGFRVAQELQGHVFVIVGGLRVLEDSRHLLVMRTAQHELAVMEALLCNQRKGFRRHLQKGFVANLSGFYQLFRTGNLVILRGVRTQLEHGCVFKVCHMWYDGLIYKYTKKWLSSHKLLCHGHQD